jgi:hypothetical protein
MPVCLYVLIYVLVLVVGHYLVATCMYGMRRLIDLKVELPFHEWMATLVGVTERAVALTLVIWAPRYLAAFIGGWVLLKFAIGWRRTPLNYNVALGSQLALIGNILSFAIAIAGGLYLNHNAMTYFGALD